MGTKRSQRVAAALAVAAGMTLLSGVTAQAETTGISSNAPAEVTPANIVGPFPTELDCENHRSIYAPGASHCLEENTGQWFYEV